MTRALLLFCGWFALQASAQELRSSLAERFANPPNEARILKIIHSWPDDAKTQDETIERLQRQGFGGTVCNVSFNDYLESETKWQAFTRAMNAARKAGQTLWLYDERGYPSATAGGLVLRNHPEWEARGLLIADTQCDGGTVTLQQPPDTLLLAAAYKVRNGQMILGSKQDLLKEVRDRELRWEAPPGPLADHADHGKSSLRRHTCGNESGC